MTEKEFLKDEIKKMVDELQGSEFLNIVYSAVLHRRFREG